MSANIDTEGPNPAAGQGPNAPGADVGWMRVLPLAGIVASIGYLLFMGFNISSFTYYPAINEFNSGVTRQPYALAGPPMYWYGWILNSMIAGAVAGIVALFLPRRWIDVLSSRPLAWLVWGVPIAVFIVMTYTHWHFFTS